MERWRTPTPSSRPLPVPPEANLTTIHVTTPGNSKDNTPPSCPVIEIREVFDLVNQQEEISWEPFREGVDIHRLYGDGKTGPAAALLRFREKGRVPLHQHQGWEHILVLSGSQRDEFGTIEAGTLRVHAPGTSHRIISEAGCIVLAIYEKPVTFLET